MAKTALETPTEERVYTPASIDEKRRNFPAVGRKIRITYERGKMEKEESARSITRWATVVCKNKMHFTVEVIPETRTGRRGRYRLAFQFVDLMTGRVKIAGVE